MYYFILFFTYSSKVISNKNGIIQLAIGSSIISWANCTKNIYHSDCIDMASHMCYY